MSEQHVVHDLRADAGGPLGRRPTAALGLGLCAVTFLAGLAIAGVTTRVGAAPAAPRLSALVGDLALATFALALLVVAGLAYVLRLQVPREGHELTRVRDRPRFWFLQEWALLFVLLAAVAAPSAALLLLLRGKPTLPVPAIHSAGAGGLSQRTAAAPTGGDATVGHLNWAVFIVLGALALVVLLALAAKRRSSQVPVERDADAMPQAVDAAIEDLESERDPRRAVIRAYATMEAALGEQGLPRRPSEAPHEYLTRASSRMQAGGGPVRRLTTLFEHAKFSRHEIDEGTRADALSALEDLRSELERSR